MPLSFMRSDNIFISPFLGTNPVPITGDVMVLGASQIFR